MRPGQLQGCEYVIKRRRLLPPLVCWSRVTVGWAIANCTGIGIHVRVVGSPREAPPGLGASVHMGGTAPCAV